MSKPYRTPQDAIEAQIAPYRSLIIAGFVRENAPKHRSEDIAVPTTENVTVIPSEGSTWVRFTVYFLIDGVPAAFCSLERTLLYGLMGATAEIEALRSQP